MVWALIFILHGKCRYIERSGPSLLKRSLINSYKIKRNLESEILNTSGYVCILNITFYNLKVFVNEEPFWLPVVSHVMTMVYSPDTLSWREILTDLMSLMGLCTGV